MSGEYGYNTINGEDIAVVPGGIVRLGDRENIVEARSHSLRWNHLPDQSFVGGALKDSFYGGSGTFYGKDGNDEFYLYGGLSSTGGQIFAYGGNGNDMMAGTTGMSPSPEDRARTTSPTFWAPFPKGKLCLMQAWGRAMIPCVSNGPRSRPIWEKPC